ncbi:MAG: hypothetical protein U0996_04940 [Planctomycetaceae bacterium]
MVNFDIPWEDNYVGQWADDPQQHLSIRKVRDRHYLATLLIDGQPIARPWMDNAPTVDMPAIYTFTPLDGSDFSIDLWTKQRFTISLDYEPNFQIYDHAPCGSDYGDHTVFKSRLSGSILSTTRWAQTFYSRQLKLNQANNRMRGNVVATGFDIVNLLTASRDAVRSSSPGQGISKCLCSRSPVAEGASLAFWESMAGESGSQQFSIGSVQFSVNHRAGNKFSGAANRNCGRTFCFSIIHVRPPFTCRRRWAVQKLFG